MTDERCIDCGLHVFECECTTDCPYCGRAFGGIDVACDECADQAHVDVATVYEHRNGDVTELHIQRGTGA